MTNSSIFFKAKGWNNAAKARSSGLKSMLSFLILLCAKLTQPRFRNLPTLRYCRVGTDIGCSASDEHGGILSLGCADPRLSFRAALKFLFESSSAIRAAILSERQTSRLATRALDRPQATGSPDVGLHRRRPLAPQARRPFPRRPLQPRSRMGVRRRRACAGLVFAARRAPALSRSRRRRSRGSVGCFAGEPPMPFFLDFARRIRASLVV